MAEQGIIRLSTLDSPQTRPESAVVMVGSFAPVHRGHFDAISAASDALINTGERVGSIVLTPNSATYVRHKLPEYHKIWTYEQRVQEILTHNAHPIIPTYVDDISGGQVDLEQINHRIPHTMRRYLGITASRTHLVVGSDQLLSIESHMADTESRAICVLRPGHLGSLVTQLHHDWAKKALEGGRLIITDREDMETDISSTTVREMTRPNKIGS